MNVTCKICDSNAVNIYSKNVNIFNCSTCNTNFVHPISVPADYDLLYESSQDYTFHKKFATEMLKSKDPLKYLCKKYVKYHPVHAFLKSHSVKNVLEIGCGYGMLSYALSKKGIDVTAFDLSKSAIKYAKENFKGIQFHPDNVFDYMRKTHDKFDLIVSIAVIEHLEDPVEFVKLSKNSLSENGHILLLTPNKDFWNKSLVWGSDPPPRHWFWLSHESFKKIGEKASLNHRFINMNNSIQKENNLLEYVLKGNQKFTLNIAPVVHQPSKKRSMYKKALHTILVSNPIRNLSNAIYPHNKKLAVLYSK